MDNKTTYESPDMQFILSDEMDIISSSGGIGQDPGNNDGEWM